MKAHVLVLHMMLLGGCAGPAADGDDFGNEPTTTFGTTVTGESGEASEAEDTAAGTESETDATGDEADSAEGPETDADGTETTDSGDGASETTDESTDSETTDETTGGETDTETTGDDDETDTTDESTASDTTDESTETDTTDESTDTETDTTDDTTTETGGACEPYADPGPSGTGCCPGEMGIGALDIQGFWCAGPCELGQTGDCAAGSAGTPACAIDDGMGGGLCALLCNDMQNSTDCPTGMTCQDTGQMIGLCTWG